MSGHNIVHFIFRTKVTIGLQSYGVFQTQVEMFSQVNLTISRTRAGVISIFKLTRAGVISIFKLSCGHSSRQIGLSCDYMCDYKP